MKQIPAILLVAASWVAHADAAEPLGRLFFTPAQRNTLDAGKELDRPKQAGPAVRGPRSLTVNGVVTRSDGDSTVWVNGSPAKASRANAGTITAQPTGTASAKVRVMDSDARLRVGQTLDRRTGKITESYQRAPTMAEMYPDAPSAAPAPNEAGKAGAATGTADKSDDATEHCPAGARTLPRCPASRRTAVPYCPAPSAAPRSCLY